MNTNITKKLFAFLSLTVLFAFVGNASAQDVSDEYNEAMTQASEVTDWDTNNNGILDDNEFYVVNYRIWDVDSDGQLTNEEWQSGMDYYVTNYDMTDYGVFTDWDTNQDDMVDVNEYIIVMGENDVYGFKESMKDTQSGQATAQNTEDPTLKIWHLDNDNLVEKIEYGDWSYTFDKDDN
ncbi:hypothetical protein WJR50_27605 [Catalinimonas sp. 4WD22]|uniref:hypothetical protein n=1 Tax=Catalinimonas locisalis TaxID=3133978 RepID=UPI0031013CEC